MSHIARIILGLFFVAAFFRMDFYFKIVYLVAGVYVLTQVWMRRAQNHLHITRTFVNRAFPGETVPVTLTLTNRSWLPVPWIEVHESLPVHLISTPHQSEVLSLGPREHYAISYALECRRRGYYDIGPTTFKAGDLLGLRTSQGQQVPAEYLIIYPQITPLEKLGLPTHSPFAVLPTPNPLFEDPTRIMGVRDYHPGDSPRRLHWTATAATGRLLVKRYAPAIARETFIALDLDATHYSTDQWIRRSADAVEMAVTTTASIAHHIIVREGLPVGLTTYAWDPLIKEHLNITLPLHQGRAHLMTLLEILARAESPKVGTLGEGEDFPDRLRRESIRLGWGTTVVVITGHQNQALYDSLFYLRRAGFAVTLILVAPPAPPQADQSIKGITVYRVWEPLGPTVGTRGR